MDAESTVISWLSEHLDCPVAGAAPRPIPDRLVTVERTGGPEDSLVLDRAALAVQAWGRTLEGASALATEARAALRGMDELDGVVSVDIGGTYRFPAEDGRPRYQIAVDVTCYL